MTTKSEASARSIRDLVVEGKVHRDIYVSADVFEQEMREIFEGSWVYVAHESEIPQPGDYRKTELGRVPIIVTRDEAGAIHVLFNRCTHRAAMVCQEDQGNSNYFRCSYHGWTFRNNGELVGASFENGYDPRDFGRERFGLGAVARVESYRGFIFASLNPNVMSLTEYLGPAANYLDLFVDLSPDGEIIARSGTHRYGYDGNWKFQMENGVDGYHPNFTHESFFFQGGPLMAKMFNGASPNYSQDLGNGHSVIDMRPLLSQAGGMVSFVAGVDQYREQLVERLGEERADEVLRSGGGTGFNLAIFPNLLIIGVQIRNVRPRRVDRTDVELFPTLLKGAPDIVNAGRLRGHESFYGPAGAGAPDDLEMFRRVQEGLKVGQMPWLHFLRGLRREELRADGTRVGHVTDELPQRAFYRQWQTLIEA